MSEKLNYCSVIRKIVNKLDFTKVLDLFVFGSAVKGKAKPNDIDLCIVFNKNLDVSFTKELSEKLELDGIRAHISSLTANDFFRNPHALAQTVLFEGVSVLTGKPLSELYGLHPRTLYVYDISDLEKTKKVRFVQTVKGKNYKKGLIEELGGAFIAPAAFTVPVEKDSEILELMAQWEIKFKRSRVFFVD